MRRPRFRRFPRRFPRMVRFSRPSFFGVLFFILSIISIIIVMAMN